MAKQKDVNGKMFEVGNEAKKGKESLEGETREVRKASINEFIRCFSKWLEMPIGEINKIAKDKEQIDKLTALDAIAISNIQKAAVTGRSDHLNRHLDRLWGKPKETVELSNPDGTLASKAQVVIFKLPDNGTEKK